MNTINDWYRRHETERCLCGHERREHPHQPAILPGTPGCTGTLDYAAECECPRFRYAVEEAPAPDDLDTDDMDPMLLDEPWSPADVEFFIPSPALAGRRRFLLWNTIEPEAAERCGFAVGGNLAAELEPDIIMAWAAEIEADRELFIAALLREGLE